MTDLFTSTPDQGLELDPTKSLVEQLVGDGKKFKDLEALAKGKAEADLYVRTLEQQKDELRSDFERLQADYNARAKIEELMDQLKVQNLTSSTHTPANEDDNSPSFKPEDIENMVASKLDQIETKKRETLNYNKVQAKLQETLGDNYSNVLKRQADALGLSTEDVNALARKSPDAFFRVMELDRQPQTTDVSLPRNERTSSFAPSTIKRDWNYYEKLRKEDASTYYNPKTQVQMHRDAIALGDAFVT